MAETQGPRESKEHLIGSGEAGQIPSVQPPIQHPYPYGYPYPYPIAMQPIGASMNTAHSSSVTAVQTNQNNNGCGNCGACQCKFIPFWLLLPAAIGVILVSMAVFKFRIYHTMFL